MGVVEGTKEGLGLEGSGVIRQIGPNVKDLKIGDRVLISDHGYFSTRLVTSSRLCVKMPDDLSFEEAATMPCVYSTAIFSLLTLGRLQKDQVCLPNRVKSNSGTHRPTECSNPVRLRRSRHSSNSDM